MRKSFSDPQRLADVLVEQLGGDIVLGLPLGLGKANHLANALIARAMADRDVRLQIFSALTLEPPQPKTDLERRFLGPVIERTMGGYPALAYVDLQRRDALPANVTVDEFFFQAGTRLGVHSAQRSYISANYTHAAAYLLDRGVNLVAQLVARRGGRLSLSCNTDITLDLLAARQRGETDFLLVGQVNDELPFMPGEGDMPIETCSHLLEGPGVQFPLFGPPKEPVTDAHYAIGFHAAGLVRDGGTLQMGIGSTSDAVAQALIVRQRQPEAFGAAMARLGAGSFEAGPFDQGLYAATEMFVDCLWDLRRAGILKREVEGAVLEAGFFLGPRSFYRALCEAEPEELAKFQMRAISYVNELYGNEEIKRQARVGARFINTAMMATLLGAIVSDGLEDGRVVSGVGGQYNFVAQAFALKGARSIITLDAVHGQGKTATSNILWSYGHGTIPRHLRDIVITEYGVADLRGRTDRDVIVALLGVADSRFQAELLDAAKRSNKLEAGYVIPAQHAGNTPERIAEALEPLKRAGLAPPLPFGSDFDEEELALLPALGLLKGAIGDLPAMARLAIAGMAGGRRHERKLARLALDRPRSLRDWLSAFLVRGAISKAEARAPSHSMGN
ncbi:acetyl-CoA hydrolase/transferase C-terminal domain-containing protein [Phenylobacterium koreense]|uniref:Acyl-CoA hydrolase n=1 Tax=Phenylobacterium koreense TaxID=266125 RepID=A0ABV2EQ57_9CAUL